PLLHRPLPSLPTRRSSDLHGQIFRPGGAGDRLDRRLAVLLHAAAGLSRLILDHDRTDSGAVRVVGGELRFRGAALQPSLVLLPRSVEHTSELQSLTNLLSL